jgi:hypothetical protein
VNTTDGSIGRIIRALAAQGWGPPEFAANHLEYASALHLGENSGPVHASFERYWRTVGRISSLLREEGIFHVIIKTRRSYPYSDTNVDVYIQDGDWPVVRDVLSRDQWRMPSRAVRFKQRLIERAKIKLPPRVPGLVPAHVYYAVSWRYQRDVTFLDPQMVEEVPLVSEAPQLRGEVGSQTVPMPSRPADLLLHAAEIVFENYRITLGEALYMSWLLQKVSSLDRRRVYRLGIERGAGNALRCMIRRAKAIEDKDGAEVGVHWPKNYSAPELVGAWWERLAEQANHGRALSGIEEFIGYGAWASMYRVKRALFK